MEKVVMDVLRLSNWTEKREIDIDELEKHLIEKNFVVFEKAKDFLKEYGLLNIKFTHPLDKRYTSEIKVDTKRLPISKSLVDTYGKHFNKLMVPVAQYQLNSMTICISDDGMFYGGFDESVIVLGMNFEEALYNLIRGVRLDVNYVLFD